MGKINYDGEVFDIVDGESLVEVCEQIGVPFACYSGSCGACEIEIEEGEDNLSEPTDMEIAKGLGKKRRLACQCKLKHGDVKIKF